MGSYVPGMCQHKDKEQRRKLPHGMVKCLKCGKELKDVHYKVRHGTYRGYNKHRYEAAGRWPWPIPGDDPCGCREAGTEANKDKHKTPKNREMQSQRASARSAALMHLKRAFPALYMKLYAEALEKSRGRAPAPYAPAREFPLWDDLLARLVKEAMGRDELDLAERVRGRLASRQEVEVHRLVARLRVLLAAGGGRAQAEPGQSR